MSRFDICGGQPRAWSILARSFASNRAASTYLFHGPEGVGAWSLALEFTALLNCLETKPGAQATDLPRPCGECRHCRSIFTLNFEGLLPVVPIGKHKNEKAAIDLTNEFLEARRTEPFTLLDRTESVTIPIDRAREVKRSLAVRAGEGIKRVALFYQLDRMRASSADALLKLIEEPPADTTIILTTSRPEALLDTILSRSQKIRLDPLPEKMIAAYLTERYDLSEDAARLASRISERSLARALANSAERRSDEADLRSVALLLFKTLMTGSGPDLVAQLNDLINMRDRGGAEELIRVWQSLIRDGAYYAGSADESGLVNVDFATETKAQAGRFALTETVERMVATTKNSLADLALNVHIQAALVAMALKLKEDLEAGDRLAAR